MNTKLENPGLPEYCVIGCGSIGQQILRGFETKKVEVGALDLNPKRCGPHRVLWHAQDFKYMKAVFVCVPTPGGQLGYNLKHISDVFKNLVACKFKGLIIMVSTIDPNAYCAIMKIKPKGCNIIVMPEFMVENSMPEAFFYDDNVVYGPWINQKVDQTFREALRMCKCSAFFVRLPAAEVCLLKVGRNLALTMKLLTANIISGYATQVGMTKEHAQKIVSSVFNSDRRLTTQEDYHMVAKDGKKGVGGKCLPKDLEALAWTHHNDQLVSDALRSLWRLNKGLRLQRR